MRPMLAIDSLHVVIARTPLALYFLLLGLELALAAALQTSVGSRNLQGFALVFAGLAMGAAIVFSVSQDSQQMAQLLRVLSRE